MTFRILPGLPGDGPPPRQFTFGSKRTHAEGFVVEFTDAVNAWVGNFQLGLSSYSAAFDHPDGRHVVVVGNGQGYIIDPSAQSLVEEFGGALMHVWQLDKPRRLIFDESGITFNALGVAGWLWRTSRISWDGFREVVIRENSLIGDAWNAIDQTWERFSVDLHSGAVDGGAFHIAERSSNER